MKKTTVFLFTLFLISATCKVYAQKTEDVTIIKLDSVSGEMKNLQWWRMSGSSWTGEGGLPGFANWATFHYKGAKYYVYLYVKQAGHYLSPAAKQDYVVDYQTAYSVFTARQYNDIIVELTKKTGQVNMFKPKFNGWIDGVKDATIKDILNERLLISITYLMGLKTSGNVFPILSQVMDGQDIVRFINPLPSAESQTALQNDYFEIPLSDFIAAMKMQ